MGTTNIILYGASGHGKVILDILQKMNIVVSYFMDDNKELKEINGIKVKSFVLEDIDAEYSCIISIGSNAIRKKIVVENALSYAIVIHPNAVISKYVDIGEGSVVMANAVINANATIGKHCIVNTASVVEHDCFIGDFVHISPSATLCGNVRIGEGTHIGAGATIIPNIKVGKWCTIGAGTVVIKDISDNAVVVGNPGRIIKQNQ
jgi:acetyltransferase EpsM